MNRKKLILTFAIGIAILNVFDGLLTYFGIVNQLIEELNPLMNLLITNHPALFIGLKIFLSLSILMIAYYISLYSKATFQRIFFYSLVGVFSIYTTINCLHIYWFTLAFY